MIKELLEERILILDGGLGTMIQGYELTENDYRGERFADFAIPLKGNYNFKGPCKLAMKQVGIILTFASVGAFSPIGIPLWCTADKRAKVRSGTLLYLEME